MDDIENAENLEQHQNEFAEFLDFYLRENPFNIKATPVNFDGHNCFLDIQSDNQFYDDFNEQAILQHIFERAIGNFSQRQYFTDFDGVDFGLATIWENPDIAINGQAHRYQIRTLIFLEALEQGHEYDAHILILI